MAHVPPSSLFLLLLSFFLLSLSQVDSVYELMAHGTAVQALPAATDDLLQVRKLDDWILEEQCSAECGMWDVDPQHILHVGY